MFDPGRKAFRQLVHGVDDALGGRQRIRPRPLEDPDPQGGIAIKVRIARIVLCGKLDAGDIPQPHDRGGGLFHDDIGKFVGIREPSKRLHRDLKRSLLGDRGLIEHAGGDLDILTLQRLHDVGRGQADRLQAVGIDPDAHRIVAAAEDGDRAHPVDAGQNVGDRERRIV